MDILSPLFRKEHRVLLKISEMMDEARGKGGEARLALFKTAERYLGDHLDVMHEHTTDFARAYQVVGWELVQLSEVSAGLQCFDRAIALAPSSGQVWAQKAVALQLLQDHEGSLRATARAQELEPDVSTHWRQMGETYLAMGRTVEASNALRQALVRDPTQLDLYDRVSALDPTDVEVRVRKCAALARAGRYEEAAEASDALLALTPPVERVRLVKVEALESQQRWGDAVEELDRYLKATGRDAEELAHRARLHRRAGLRAQAVHDLDAALRSDASHPQASQWWEQRAEELASLRRFPDALDSVDHALGLRAGDLGLQTLRCEIQLQAGDVAGAKKALEDILLVDPHFLRAVRAKANVLLEVGDLEGSAAYLDQLVEGEPEAEDLRQRADVAMMLDQWGLAVDYYRAALERDPRLPSLYAALGEGLTALERLEEAEEAFAAQVRISPTDAQSWQRRGEVLYYLHRHGEARESLQRALSLAPTFEEASQTLRLVEEAIEGATVEQYCRQLLYYEEELARRPTKEEVFRLGIPFDLLDKVQHFLDHLPQIEVYELPFEEWEALERDSQRIVPRLRGAVQDTTLSEVARLVPEYDVTRAKEVLSYLHTVARMDVAISAEVDPLLEQRARSVLELPQGDRTLPGVMVRLGVGIHEAGEILTLLRALRGEQVCYRQERGVPDVTVDGSPRGVTTGPSGASAAAHLMCTSGIGALSELQHLARADEAEAPKVKGSASARGRHAKGHGGGAAATVAPRPHRKSGAAHGRRAAPHSDPSTAPAGDGHVVAEAAAVPGPDDVAEDEHRRATARPKGHQRGHSRGQAHPSAHVEAGGPAPSGDSDGTSTKVARRRERHAAPTTFLDEEGTLDADAYLASVLGRKARRRAAARATGRGRYATTTGDGGDGSPEATGENPFEDVVSKAEISVAEIEDLARARGTVGEVAATSPAVAEGTAPHRRSRGRPKDSSPTPARHAPVPDGSPSEGETDPGAEASADEMAAEGGSSEDHGIPEIDPALLTSIGAAVPEQESGGAPEGEEVGLAARGDDAEAGDEGAQSEPDLGEHDPPSEVDPDPGPTVRSGTAGSAVPVHGRGGATKPEREISGKGGWRDSL